jgi:hypothetical protein
VDDHLGGIADFHRLGCLLGSTAWKKVHVFWVFARLRWLAMWCAPKNNGATFGGSRQEKGAIFTSF